MDSFADSSLDALICHALKALAASLAGDSELDAASVSLSIVGKDRDLEILEGADVQQYLDMVLVMASAQGGNDEDDSLVMLDNPDV